MDANLQKLFKNYPIFFTGFTVNLSSAWFVPNFMLVKCMYLLDFLFNLFQYDYFLHNVIFTSSYLPVGLSLIYFYLSQETFYLLYKLR